MPPGEFGYRVVERHESGAERLVPTRRLYLAHYLAGLVLWVARVSHLPRYAHGFVLGEHWQLRGPCGCKSIAFTLDGLLSMAAHEHADA